MRPTLKHRPTDYILRRLLVKYGNRQPLSCAELADVDRLGSFLSLRGHDEIVNYYYDSRKSAAFPLPDQFTPEKIASLKHRLQILLQKKGAHVELRMKPEQFLQLRAMTVDELILYHGNQFLTGAPFFPGGITHTLFFQWGNLFGVAKYVDLAEEYALKSNVLIHFELMHERYLEQCVEEFKKKNWLQQQAAFKMAAPAPIPQAKTAHEMAPMFKIPSLRLSLSRNSSHEEG